MRSVTLRAAAADRVDPPEDGDPFATFVEGLASESYAVSLWVKRAGDSTAPIAVAVFHRW